MLRKHKCSKCGSKCKKTMKYCPECGYPQFQEKSEAETRQRDLSALHEIHNEDKFIMNDDIPAVSRDIDMSKAQKAFEEMQDNGGFFAED